MSQPELPDLGKLLAAILGSFVSLKFVPGTPLERLFVFVGGCALSYYSTGPLAKWIGGTDLAGLISFICGLLGMTIVAKVYEVLQLLDARQIATDVWAAVKRKWGA